MKRPRLFARPEGGHAAQGACALMLEQNEAAVLQRTAGMLEDTAPAQCPGHKDRPSCPKCAVRRTTLANAALIRAGITVSPEDADQQSGGDDPIAREASGTR